MTHALGLVLRSDGCAHPLALCPLGLVPDAYHMLTRSVRFLIGLFFRRIEVVGLENIPRSGGGIVVSWHPNGLIDPGLIFACFPREVVFGARHGLFNWPVLGAIMRAVGTVPIYRRQDTRKLSPEARRRANQQSLDALAQAVSEGGFSCLFPEGDSHDAPHLLALKTGAARFYYRARQLRDPSGPPPVILPVGLHYDAKRRFRSSVLITFHPPLQLPSELDLTPAEDEPQGVVSARCRSLTSCIEIALQEVVHATESWELHHLLHRARRLLRAERSHRAGVQLPEPDMVEWQVGYARMWAGHAAWLERDAGRLESVLRRLKAYDRDLRALGLEDEDLDRPPERARTLKALLLMGQVGLIYLIMPGLLVLGGSVNILPHLALRFGSRAAAKRHKDEASIKLLGGVVLYPLCWLVAALLAARASQVLHELYPVVPATPIAAAIVVVVLAITGGIVSMRYLRLARETARAVSVRMTRSRERVNIARLRVERGELMDLLDAMTEDMDLPGSVTAQGQVLPTEEVQPGGRA